MQRLSPDMVDLATHNSPFEAKDHSNRYDSALPHVVSEACTPFYCACETLVTHPDDNLNSQPVSVTRLAFYEPW
jgi:hypothetical protein